MFIGIEIVGYDASVIPHGRAWFKCETNQSISLGEQTMLVGRVIEFAKISIPLLVFRGGQFQQLGQTAQVVTQAATWRSFPVSAGIAIRSPLCTVSTSSCDLHE
jgi:hypothetical protein